MKTYIAIIADDRNGPAYGVGETESDARDMAVESGFDREDGTAIEIAEESYQAILAGNPDVEMATVKAKGSILTGKTERLSH